MLKKFLSYFNENKHLKYLSTNIKKKQQTLYESTLKQSDLLMDNLSR